MTAIVLDANNILSVWDIRNVWKAYTRSFYGYPMVAYDHTILVYHKWSISQKQWKDIGAGQYVMQTRLWLVDDVSTAMQLWMARIWFDILYKYDDIQWNTINIAKPDNEVIDYANKTFGTTRTALVMPSYDSCLHEKVILSFLFGIAIGHGKWTIKNNILMPVKITLPLTSSLLWQKEFCENIGHRLHACNILHSIQFTSSWTYEVMQLTLHDAWVLQLFATWLNPVVKIDQISTLENTKKVYDALIEYARENWLVLPIQWVSEILVLEAN